MAFSYMHAMVLNFYLFSSLTMLGNTIYVREGTLEEESQSFRFDAPRGMFTVWCRNWSGFPHRNLAWNRAPRVSGTFKQMKSFQREKKKGSGKDKNGQRPTSKELQHLEVRHCRSCQSGSQRAAETIRRMWGSRIQKCSQWGTQKNGRSVSAADRWTKTAWRYMQGAEQHRQRPWEPRLNRLQGAERRLREELCVAVSSKWKHFLQEGGESIRRLKKPRKLARLRVLIKATSPAGPFPGLYRQLTPARERRLWWSCLQAEQGAPGM